MRRIRDRGAVIALLTLEAAAVLAAISVNALGGSLVAALILAAAAPLYPRLVHTLRS